MWVWFRLNNVKIENESVKIIVNFWTDSQESYWSHYTAAGSLSAQSSQEDCPDVGEGGGGEEEGTLDYTAYHRILELTSCVQLTDLKMYK